MRWRLHRVRRARIPDEHRDLFERFGAEAIRIVITSGFTPAAPELQPVYSQAGVRKSALDWLTERADQHERDEQRRERLEWWIMWFVIAGVVVELATLAHGLFWHH
jgi:hypothetical protein